MVAVPFAKLQTKCPLHPCDQRANHSMWARRSPSCANGSDSIVLSGDVGGTNARLQLWKISSANGAAECQPLSDPACLKADNHPTFYDALNTFLRSTELGDERINSACIAVAGPVKNNGIRALTNRSQWGIEGDEIQGRFPVDTATVINDFEATGYGVLALDDSQVKVLYPGESDRSSPRANALCLGPGTGLGIAQLIYNPESDQHLIIPTEGGHADFAPRGDIQRDLAKFVAEGPKEVNPDHPGLCEVEDILCGQGLWRIFSFLYSRASEEERQKASPPEEMTPPMISQRGLSGECALCAQTLDLFLDCLGAEAAGSALRMLAFGGVYVCGGIPPKLLSKLVAEDGSTLGSNFMRQFLNPDCRFLPILKRIPVYLVLDDLVGLLGAREKARALLH